MSNSSAVARLLDWLLGLLPGEPASAPEPPEPVENGGEGNLGPEMDPNGNPANPQP